MYMVLLSPDKMKRLILFVLNFLIILFLIFSCSPKTRYQVLSFFFDGVPNPEQPSKKQSNRLAADSLNNKSRKLTLRQHQTPEQTMHPPFADRDCGACHDMRGGNSLIAPMPDLCYECHDDFRQEMPKLHGLVEAGACTTCHHPHVSKNKMLLTRSGQEMCLHCHDTRDVQKNEVHEEVEAMACTECHDAHGGEEPPFLK